MDEGMITAVLSDIQVQLKKLNTGLEDVRSEISSVYTNMEDNYGVESRLEDLLTELKSISKKM